MLEATNLTVRFGEKIALDAVSLTVTDGEVLAVLGPSGSGKTTLLRVIAGLQAPGSGSLSWDGQPLDQVAAHERGFGLMFQDYALFPHRTVAGNVAFGLRMAGMAGDRIEERVAVVLDWVGLPGYQDRSVGNLSGGEQQRVALARALAPAPRMLMLDEPVGSLDRGMRERLVGELRQLFVEHGITTLYVTHDQEEAFGLADRIVIMKDGSVAQEGTPEQVWRQPVGEWVARFLGFDNIIDATITEGVAQTSFGRFGIAGPASGSHRLVIRPDGFTVAAGGTIQGTVVTRSFRGGHYQLAVEAGPGVLLEMEIDEHPVPAVGEVVTLSIDPEAVVVLD
ncbi:MAG: ABC transporter ATP-binding protein [Acidimicrobiia bacterium]|nr:ABC transporter ATP-binding protein [Acidimicrobiia bacterium]MDH3398267.1 ABC transporter ATP-binding protein [Acidimicrobiia bacterium]MDH5615318.1 ABC transporter ATP-binding protein [Acidimicrobiia bacterium]